MPLNTFISHETKYLNGSVSIQENKCCNLKRANNKSLNPSDFSGKVFQTFKLELILMMQNLPEEGREKFSSHFMRSTLP